MPELLSVTTAVAEHRVSALDTKRQLAESLSAAAAARFANLVDASRNETRYSVLPLAQLQRLQGVESRNQAYGHHALRIGEAVARAALRRAGVAPQAVTAVVGVSSTGYLMPTLETHLVERLQLSANCRRVPLTQLGCAGGAAGLALASELCATASARVLLVSVELPSLSFPAEACPTDIIASIQFGDGAAAAVISGGTTERGPELVATGSVLFPQTIERDGVTLTSAGLRLQRPRGLADILRRQLGDAVDRFLAQHELHRRDIDFWILHPRNPELLDAAAASLDLPDAALTAARAVWRRSGNLISAAVFHVLDELAAATPPASGRLGMMIAFGAGFGCEMVVLRAAGWLSDAAPGRASSARGGGAASFVIA